MVLAVHGVGMCRVTEHMFRADARPNLASALALAPSRLTSLQVETKRQVGRYDQVSVTSVAVPVHACF